MDDDQRTDEWISFTKWHTRREAGSQSHGAQFRVSRAAENHKESGMKKLGKALGAVALVGAIAAGGAAFTESNSLPAANVAGYGTVAGRKVAPNPNGHQPIIIRLLI